MKDWIEHFEGKIEALGQTRRSTSIESVRNACDSAMSIYREFTACLKVIERKQVKTTTSDSELLDRFEKLIEGDKDVAFCFDHEDGYWVVLPNKGSYLTHRAEVAELECGVKRENIRDAIQAAIDYINNPPRKTIFR